MANETKQIVDMLSRCEPGRLSPDVFEAVARLVVYPAVEFIPLRKNGDKIEVLLFERPEDDIMWPSMLHTPGTILRPTDLSYDDAFERLRKDELVGVEFDPPIFLGAELSRNKRGACVLLEHIINVTNEPGIGKFYDINSLPPNFIDAQYPSIKRAAIAYRNL